MKNVARRFVNWFKGRDKGTVAVTFLLSLPLLLLVIGIFVQYALLINAQLVVDRAVAAAARAAMTSLPTDPAIDPTNGPNNVARAARMVLETISPNSAMSTSEAAAMQDAIQAANITLPQGFVGRYSYAENATTVTITPIDGQGSISGNANYAQEAGPRVRITVSYNFQMTVPAVNGFVGQSDMISGLNGRFKTMTASLDVQLSPGREAASNNAGDPQ